MSLQLHGTPWSVAPHFSVGNSQCRQDEFAAGANSAGLDAPTLNMGPPVCGAKSPGRWLPDLAIKMNTWVLSLRLQVLAAMRSAIHPLPCPGVPFDVGGVRSDWIDWRRAPHSLISIRFHSARLLRRCRPPFRSLPGPRDRHAPTINNAHQSSPEFTICLSVRALAMAHRRPPPLSTAVNATRSSRNTSLR